MDIGINMLVFQSYIVNLWKTELKAAYETMFSRLKLVGY